jgi:hypothetical protein
VHDAKKIIARASLKNNDFMSAEEYYTEIIYELRNHMAGLNFF